MIQVIKDTPDLRTTKLALSGDMAIRKYLPEYGHQNAGVSRPERWDEPVSHRTDAAHSKALISSSTRPPRPAC